MRPRALCLEIYLQRKHSSVEPGIRVSPCSEFEIIPEADLKKIQFCVGSGHGMWAQFV